MRRTIKTVQWVGCFLLGSAVCRAQQPDSSSVQQQMHQMAEAVAQAQAQVDASQQQLLELKQRMAALEQRLGVDVVTTETPADKLASSIEELREQQALQQTQIATLDQEKLETQSKYPVKISGLILANGFVNTSRVDQAASPTSALGGAGSTGASLRQTVLGIDARGPHLAGAASRADLRIDFFGAGFQGGYTDTGGLLRLRTAHAALDWEKTSAFFELDRPIVNPEVPTSLTAVATPALSWSGNLWMWSPQIGLSHEMDLGRSARVSLEGALIDVPDPPGSVQVMNPSTVSLAELSRWLGGEVHFGIQGAPDREGSRPSIGVGGYISPHRTNDGSRFNAWAGTLDYRVPLPLRMEWSGGVYRGQGLGGLGGGAYKDYVYYEHGASPYRPLDDVGGWTQWKERASERLEFNGAFGIDNAFSSELYGYTSANPTVYQTLARNRTFFANAIYSPSAYLLFSVEYRHIATGSVGAPSASSNVIGVAAGYKF